MSNYNDCLYLSFATKSHFEYLTAVRRHLFSHLTMVQRNFMHRTVSPFAKKLTLKMMRAFI